MGSETRFTATRFRERGGMGGLRVGGVVSMVECGLTPPLDASRRSCICLLYRIGFC